MIAGRAPFALIAAGLVATSCAKQPAALGGGDAGTAFVESTAVLHEPPRDRFSEEGMLAEAELYIDDPTFRRRELEATFENPDNTYSRMRLSNYGRGDRGWDLLPEWNPISLPVDAVVQATIARGEKATVPPGARPLFDGKRPTTMAQWVELGRAAFFGYPLRKESVMEYALARPALATKVGVVAAPDGTFPGARLFLDTRGEPAIGITCALCHTTVRDGRLVVGEARRAFDYGALRLAYHEETKVPIDPSLARRMRSWGPGRADVSEDDDEDPVAIPDLFGLLAETSLTQAGTIKHRGPTSLAIRQETQLLHSNHQEVRPPRAIAYAMAMFLYSLRAEGELDLRPRERESNARILGQEAVARGAKYFDANCAGCHSNGARGGPIVPIERVGTDPLLSRGQGRGTGMIRPARLVSVARGAPYFHDGSVPSLEALLSRDRFRDDYAGSPLGRGKRGGHPYGLDASKEERTALLLFLRAL